jgi:hypothetical protein
MKIRITFILTDDERRAIWWNANGDNYAGHPAKCPMADRRECTHMLETTGDYLLSDYRHAWQQACDDCTLN